MLSDRASAWRAQGRRAILLETAAASAAAAISIFGAAALGDRFVPLPRGVRLASWALWAAVQAGIGWRLLWRPWRALGWDAVFDAAARAWPRTRPMLASAWALRGSAAGPGVSEELRAEHLARADRLAEIGRAHV